MELSRAFESKLIVVSEDDRQIVVGDADAQDSRSNATQTYYKTRGRPLPFIVFNLTVVQQSKLKWPPKLPISEIPPLEAVLSGKARICHYNGIALFNNWSRRAYEVGVQFRVPDSSERLREEAWAREKGFPTPSDSFATLEFSKIEEEGRGSEEVWWIDCWLPEATFLELRKSIMLQQLRSLTFGISGEHLYIDNWVEPGDKWNTWYLRSDRRDSGYSRGALCEIEFATGVFEEKVSTPTAAVTTQSTDASNEKAEAMEKRTVQLDRISVAIESVYRELAAARSMNRWMIVAVGVVALILLLR